MDIELDEDEEGAAFGFSSEIELLLPLRTQIITSFFFS